MIDMEKIEERQDEFDQLKRYVNGTRLLNAEVVELLWWSNLYRFAEDDAQYKEIAIGKKYPITMFPDVCMILYQIKYWQEISLSKYKTKHYFHKSAEEFVREFPWMSQKKVQRILKLLREMGIIRGVQGKLRSNNQKFCYQLEFFHPIVFLMYLFESLSAYMAHQKVKGEQQLVGEDFLFHFDLANVLEYCVEPVRTHCRNGWYTMYQRVGHSIPTGRTLYTNPTETTHRLLLNNTSETTKRHSAFEFSKEKEGRTAIYGESREPRVGSDDTFSLQAAAIEKLKSMTAESRDRISKLRVGSWRKATRKGHYTGLRFRTASQWYSTLTEKDQQLVIAFQEDQYGGDGRIDQRLSYDCSAVDAYELEENFLQFMLNRNKNEFVDLSTVPDELDYEVEDDLPVATEHQLQLVKNI